VFCPLGIPRTKDLILYFYADSLIVQWLATLLQTELETATNKTSEANTNSQYIQNNLLNAQTNVINEQEKRKVTS
jgi:hypothetical protein